jgi:carbon-monoxide dehydrogenase medium subunit
MSSACSTSLDNAKLLAGGQSLMPMLNMRYVLPDHVIDLNRVDALSFIRERARIALEIGAMTRQRDIEFSDWCARLSADARGDPQVGHRQTRNRGTLGGSLCHLDPAAELVTVPPRSMPPWRSPARTARAASILPIFRSAYMTPAIELDELLTGRRFRAGRPDTAMPSSNSRAGTAISPSSRRRC